MYIPLWLLIILYIVFAAITIPLTIIVFIVWVLWKLLCFLPYFISGIFLSLDYFFRKYPESAFLFLLLLMIFAIYVLIKEKFLVKK